MEGLVGREEELELVERFVVGADPGALLLEGPAGIGKTSLWEFGIDIARRKGVRVLVARPADEESRFAFSGLGDLLADVEAARYASIPDPQRRALETALLVRAGAESVESHAVALAACTLLRALSQDGGVLVAVDDLPWLDEPSASALAFAARRLENVRFLLAARPGSPSPLRHALERSRLERARVGPLDLAAIRHLLHARLGLTLPRRVLQRIVEVSQGNPLFAIELGRSIQLAGLPALGANLPLPATVEDLLAERVQALTVPVRRLLLAVALGPGVPATRLPGTEALPEALEEAVVIVEGDRLRLAHPLLGATVLAGSRPAERRALHLELAGAAADEEQRCFHLALATDLPDRAIAERVAAAGGRAALRGATATAAELAEHALRLTPADAPERVERCLCAAERLCAAGELVRGRAVLAPALAALPPGEGLVRACLLAIRLDLPRPPGSIQVPWRYWGDRALAASAGDAQLQAMVVAERSSGMLFADVRRIAERETELRAAAEASAGSDSATSLELLFGLSWAGAMRGRRIDDVVERARRITAPATPVHLTVERSVAVQLMWRGEIDEARAHLTELMAIADERGQAESYFVIRLHLCEVELRAGRLDAVVAWLDEWSEETEGPVGGGAGLARCRAMLAALRGEPEAIAAHLPATAEWSDGNADRWQWLESHRAAGMAQLALGDAARAAHHLRLVWDHTTTEGVDDPGVFPVAPELTETLVSLRSLDEARVVVTGLSRAASELDHPWARAAESRCRALLRPGSDEAPALLERAADSYRRLGLYFDRARTLLELGTMLRSQRRQEDGNRTLDAATRAFEELGASGWADRARAERAGPSSHATGRQKLTPAEERVARLVAAGQRNREVAAELFVNEKTVEAHLSRIYVKLGVRSRTELANRLRQSPSS